MLSAPAARVRKAACSGGSEIAIGLRIDVDYTASDHGAEPLTHVAFVEPGMASDFIGRSTVAVPASHRTNRPGDRRQPLGKERRR